MSDQDFVDVDGELENQLDDYEDENNNQDATLANILQKVQQIEEENEKIIAQQTNLQHHNNNNDKNKKKDDNNSEEKLFDQNETQITSASNTKTEEDIEYVDEVVIDDNNTNGEEINEEKKEDQEQIDKRSIFVTNVDYGTDAEELRDFFKACGTIERITIVCDKYSGKPKGCAYIQFKSEESVAIAMDLNDKEFRNRQLKIEQKRTNMPSWMVPRGRRGESDGSERGRGRGRRRGGYRGPPMPMYYAPQPMYAPAYGYYAPRSSRGYRGRRGWSPY